MDHRAVCAVPTRAPGAGDFGPLNERAFGYAGRMAILARLNVAWQNWPGAPGLTQLYFDDTSSMQTNADAVRAFFEAVKALIPTLTTITVPGSGDRIDAADGSIQGSWSIATPPALVTATGAGAYAGNAGAVVHWTTSGIVAGRRVRGRSFLVPIVSTAFETNGSLTSAALTTLTTAANTLITATTPNFKVWSRPVKAHTEYDKKTGQPTAVAARAGSGVTVNGQRIPDLAVSLRSRRT